MLCSVVCILHVMCVIYGVLCVVSVVCDVHHGCWVWVHSEFGVVRCDCDVTVYDVCVHCVLCVLCVWTCV